MKLRPKPALILIIAAAFVAFAMTIGVIRSFDAPAIRHEWRVK